MTYYIEFVGLPGSGKSFLSHKVAEELRREGLSVNELSWKLDHLYGKYNRAIFKVFMTLCYSVKCFGKAKKVGGIITKSGYKGLERQRFYRNILYKAFFLSKQQKNVFILDEGFAQLAISMSMNGTRSARIIYDELIQVLQFKVQPLFIKIECDIDTALSNMQLRETQDSKVEKMHNINEKKRYLSCFKEELEAINISKSLSLSFDLDERRIINEIVFFIKEHIVINNYE